MHDDFSRQEAIKTNSPRSFGLLFAGVFALFAVAPLLHGGEVRLWLLALAALMLALALTAPHLLAPFNRAWALLGMLLNKITAPLLMGIIFIAIFTPVAIVLRAVGKTPLALRFDSAAPSYWTPRNPPGPLPETMRDQF